MRTLIGTSGFMIGKQKWLKIEGLNCIEINSTFYHLPSDKIIKSWLEYPEHIKISFKAPKYITHTKRLNDVKESWELFWEKIKVCGDKIISVLFQLPPSFAYNEINMNRILIMKEYLPNNINIVIEFRNKSWLTQYVYSKMESSRIIICATYIYKSNPSNKNHNDSNWLGDMPSGLNFGNPFDDIAYMRVHGMKGYKGELNDKQLLDIYNKLKIGGTKKHIIIIFNNVFFKNKSKFELINKEPIKYAAVCNAFKINKLIKNQVANRMISK